MVKVYLESLGCPKNTVDSEYILGLLRKLGCKLVKTPEKADCIIVNTCGFIQPAKEESIDTILELGEIKKKKNSKLFVCGCLYERYREQLIVELPEVDGFLGVYELSRITEMVTGVKYEGSDFFRHPLSPKHIGYLKIGDGCSNKCTFCSIPLIKGKFWSKSIETVVEEAKFMIKSGVKEINIVAQDTTAYLFDKGMKNGLLKLLEKLERLDGIKWIRLLYTYPSYITDDLIDFIASSDRVVHYLDVPFQHVSDKILKDMGRGYTREHIEDLLNKLRRKIPDISLRSTFIVGFPTEDDSDFEELIKFLEEYRLDWAGFFRYYHEDGTKAFESFDDLDDQIKEERLMEAQSVALSITEDKNSEFIGRRFEVVVDGEDEEFEGFLKSRSYRSAYEIDGVCLIKNDNIKSGEFLTVEAKDVVTSSDLLVDVV